MPIDALTTATAAGSELPAGINGKTLVFGGSGFTGLPVQGRVIVSAPRNVVHLPTGRRFFSGDVAATYIGGVATFPGLVANDAPGLSRYNWTYRVRFQIDGAIERPEPFDFVLADAGPAVVDGDRLSPVPASAGTPVSTAAVLLPPGGVDGQVLGLVGGQLVWVTPGTTTSTVARVGSARVGTSTIAA